MDGLAESLIRIRKMQGRKMFEHKTEEEARKEILNMVEAYCDKYHGKKNAFAPGERIPYASRVYDHEEMCSLVDSALEFWLTSGRYTTQFEKEFAEYVGVKYCSLVNSGSLPICWHLWHLHHRFLGSGR